MSTFIMLESLAWCQSFKGYDLTKQKSPGYSHAISRVYRNSIFMLYSVKKQVPLLPHGASHGIFHRTCVSEKFFKRSPLNVPSWRGLCKSRWERLQTNVAYDVAGAVEVIHDLGLDTLTFLAVTVLIVPTFKSIKASPILGFFCAGVVLNQFGLIRNLTDVKALSEWGILFLLFEMGLELSLARLKALAKYAFGMGLTQVVLSTLAFTAFELPPNGAVGTKILEFLFHSRPDLVNIRSVDEAVVIGAALSLSSSAFVLQLLAERGELPTRFGSATLGILLLQDLAVVPLLVILPILESQNITEGSIWPMLAQESLKALGGLGLLSLGAKYILRRVFEVVADTRSSEAFVALCLLTVAGTSLVTQNLGFSDTLGAFLAGAILAETNFRTQIEADIRPFRGLLLGLFFLTTGTSIDMQLLLREWPNVLSLLGGLIVIKTLIITAIGPRVGLTLKESVRIGLLLSQGGEFGFVVFSLANRLGVLPLELNKLLIIVVVLSMALTPFLNEAGRRAASFIEDKFDAENKQNASETVNFNVSEPVVILGFGQMGQVLANFLSNPLASGGDSDEVGWPYVAFDLDPSVVKAARKIGFPVLYGDGSRPDVLHSAGVSIPKAFMIMYTGKKKTIEAVQRLRLNFPAIPIYARARDLKHLLDLKKAGATDAILENAETSLHLGSKLLKGLGVMSDDVAFLSQLIRDSMELQAQEGIGQSEDRGLDIMKPLQEHEGKPESSLEPDMGTNSTMIPSTSWFTPKRLLAIFCVINLLNYLDRGAIASNGVNGSQRTCEGGTCKSGTGIQGDFNLNNFEDGVLSSAFMVGLLVASPIFASLAKSVNPFRLIGVGLSVWTLATLCCGFSFNFWSIAVCRMLVGVGEASFISLAAPFIDDNAPVSQKTAWLAIFYMCIPAGYAIGYIYGGLVGNHFGWRYGFWVEAILMSPFAILGFVMKPLQLKGFAPTDSEKALTLGTVASEVSDVGASNGKDEALSLKAEFRDKSSHEPSRSKCTILDQFSRFLKDMKELLLDKVFVVNVLGYIAYNFVIGAYSYWGPKAGYSIYNMTNADMMFGGITVVCGILGTVAGGFVLDFMTNTISNAFKLLSIATFIGGACCFGAFLFKSQYGFLALFAVGELLVFATQGPVNYVCLHCVKPSLRPLSMAMSTVAIHIFGDVPSSPLVGLMQDKINNWRTTALILTTIFFPAAAIWFIGIFLPSVDRFNEDSEHEVSSVERTSTAPLLEENTAETSASGQSREC